jgi:hypothetical protein
MGGQVRTFELCTSNVWVDTIGDEFDKVLVLDEAHEPDIGQLVDLCL